MKKKHKNMIRWLKNQIDYYRSEQEMAGLSIQEYSEALERYRKNGSLPREVRNALNWDLKEDR